MLSLNTKKSIYMKNSRRKFIQNASLAIMGASLKPSALWSNTNMVASKNLIGVQLYSVREDMLKNPMETLTALSKMGIEYVEHANYINRKFYGWTATEFKKVLGGLGLKMPSGHTVMDATHYDKSKKDFTDDWKRTVEDAAVMGQTYVISPSIDDNLRNTYDGLMQQLDIFNQSGELCKASGMKFGYHNHDFEFKEKLNGILMYDLILQHTDPNLMVHQLDFGNMYGAGGRAAEWINKYPGRFQSLHIKDEMKAANGKGEMNDGYESTILGDGVVDPKSIALLAKKIGGAHHYIIEQESYQGISPLDCVKINLERMKTWGI
jgi:sugar phosphate isomerase/epimerase